MKLDAYTKTVLTVIALALAVLTAQPWLKHVTVSPAEAQEPRYVVTIPKAWGKIIGFSNNNVLLEASDGTLRSVDLEAKTEAQRLKVLLKMQ